MASSVNRVPGLSVSVAAAVALGMSAVTCVLAGCDEPPKDKGTEKQPAKDAAPGAKKDDKKSEEKPALEKVTIGGKDFKLEPALDERTRFKGLSGRDSIDADGGMLFVFTHPRNLYFVMRDCPIPIDIIFLDATGRVTSMHKMVPEEERSADEKKLSPPYDGAPPEEWSNQKYEDRLRRYPSKYDAQFVIELRGNTLDSLKIKEGDQIKLDVAGLKKRAK